MENFIYILKTVLTGLLVEVCFLESLVQLEHNPNNTGYMIVVGIAAIFVLIFAKHSSIKWGSRS